MTLRLVANVLGRVVDVLVGFGESGHLVLVAASLLGVHCCSRGWGYVGYVIRFEGMGALWAGGFVVVDDGMREKESVSGTLIYGGVMSEDRDDEMCRPLLVYKVAGPTVLNGLRSWGTWKVSCGRGSVAAMNAWLGFHHRFNMIRSYITEAFRVQHL